MWNIVHIGVFDHISSRATNKNKVYLFFVFVIIVTSNKCIESRFHQPAQPRQSTLLHHKPKGLYYSPSRGGASTELTKQNEDRNKWEIYNNNKITSVAWTPETIQALLICDDVTAFEAEDYDETIRPPSFSLRRLTDRVIRKDQINNNSNESNRFSKIFNRASNRLYMAADVCRELSHACHVAVNHATERSIGAKMYRSLQYRYLVYRDDDDGDENSSTQYSGVLNEKERGELLSQAERLLTSVSKALDNDSIWTKLLEKDGVVVWRSNIDVKHYPDCLDAETVGVNKDKGSNDCSTVRSEAIMSASPKEVYEFFMDASRVHEYNDNCKELEDIEMISSNAKVSWSATGKFGPFSARDFVTLITYQPFCDKNGNNSYVSLAVNVDQYPKLAPIRNGYVRSQIRLAATFMHAVPGRPDITRFVQVTQIGELGGVADSALARKIVNNLEIKAPLDFMKRFNYAVQRSPSRTVFDRKEM